MTPAFTTVSVSRDIAGDPAAIFAHWTSPKTRVRWEAGPDTGMKYDSFDTREGGREIVRIFEKDVEIGHMVQTIKVLRPGDLLVSTVEAIFNDDLNMLMTVSVQFERHKGGTKLKANTQIMDIKGRDQTERHTRGWEWILDQFEADIAEHGLIGG